MSHVRSWQLFGLLLFGFAAVSGCAQVTAGPGMHGLGIVADQHVTWTWFDCNLLRRPALFVGTIDARPLAADRVRHARWRHGAGIADTPAMPAGANNTWMTSAGPIVSDTFEEPVSSEYLDETESSAEDAVENAPAPTESSDVPIPSESETDGLESDDNARDQDLRAELPIDDLILEPEPFAEDRSSLGQPVQFTDEPLAGEQYEEEDQNGPVIPQLELFTPRRSYVGWSQPFGQAADSVGGE